ncbi:MAG: asparagine synthase C-terminal domain-containing protein [archaeon]
MQELWKDNGQLVDKCKWGELIASLYSDEKVDYKKEAKLVLKEKLISAIRKRVPEGKYGVFFSGGVDSSSIAVIAKIFNKNLVCYSVGFQDETKEPEDIIEAKKVAEKLGFELKYKIFNLDEAEEIIKKTVKILQKYGKTDVVNIGVGAVVVAATELAKKDNVDFLFSGLGSEEIFAGYERHDKAAESKTNSVTEECWTGLKNMWGRDLVRDFNLAKELGITVATPFLDRDLITYAMQLPSEWKINKEEKKIILREVVEEYLGDFAWRKKKAAQYGSCFDKAISKLAKKNGFKLKKDWLDKIVKESN